MDVLAPIPRAAVRMTTAANDGLFLRLRPAYRRSAARRSSQVRLPHLADLLFDAGDVSECALGGMTGLIGRQAGLLEFFGFEFQIGAQFAVQVVLAMFATAPPHFSPPRRGNGLAVVLVDILPSFGSFRVDVQPSFRLGRSDRRSYDTIEPCRNRCTTRRRVHTHQVDIT